MLSLFKRKGVPDQLPAAGVKISKQDDRRMRGDKGEHDAPSAWPQIVASAYDGLTSVGEGTYGVVYRATEKKTGNLVALKKVKLSAGEGNQGVASTGVATTAIREMMLLRELNHPNVVQILDVLFHRESLELWLVFEFCPTDLRQFVKHVCRVKHSMDPDYASEPRKLEGLSPKQIQMFLHQIFTGVAYCHSNRVLHRDLKPQNILLAFPDNMPMVDTKFSSDEFQLMELLKASGAAGENISNIYLNWTHAVAKIADLGLARACGRSDLQLTQEVVTLWYRSPELLLGCQNYDRSVDVWSLGCILAELITGKPLFAGDSEIDTLYKIFHLLGTPTEDSWPDFITLPYYKAAFPRWTVSSSKDALQKNVMRSYHDPLLLDLLDKCLKYKPADRISAYSALSHPWFSQEV